VSLCLSRCACLRRRKQGQGLLYDVFEKGRSGSTDASPINYASTYSSVCCTSDLAVNLRESPTETLSYDEVAGSDDPSPIGRAISSFTFVLPPSFQSSELMLLSHVFVPLSALKTSETVPRKSVS
jgi:hypothetical protein